MFEAASHLARRGADLVQQQGDGEHQFTDNISPWAMLIMAITVVMFYVSMLKIQYSIGDVIGTLAIVEEPKTGVLVEIDTTNEDEIDAKATDGLLEPEVMLVKTRPVTSKIRTAMKHIKAKGGRRAGFRGFGLYIVHDLLGSGVAAMFASAIPMHVGRVIGPIVAHVVLAQLEMTWVHIVISEPSPKPWYQRVGSRKFWSKIAPAAAVKAIALQLTLGLPAALLCSFGPIKKSMHDPSYQFSKADAHHAVAIFSAAGIALVALVVLVYIPARVAFVRVAASMLPEEDETIVSFDRSFGGKVTPAVLGGSGKIGMLDAWKTFTWEARRRFMGLMVKVVALSIAVSMLFFMIFATEIAMFTEVPAGLAAMWAQKN